MDSRTVVGAEGLTVVGTDREIHKIEAIVVAVVHCIHHLMASDMWCPMIALVSICAGIWKTVLAVMAVPRV